MILTKLKITSGMYIKQVQEITHLYKQMFYLPVAVILFLLSYIIIVNSACCSHALVCMYVCILFGRIHIRLQICGPTSKYYTGKNSAMLQLLHKDYLLTFPLLSIARHPHLYNQLNELWHRRRERKSPSFKTAAIKWIRTLAP